MGNGLAERLEKIEKRLHRAAERSGRRRSDITLLAVTKGFPAEQICRAYGLGIRDFGENYVQEFEGKQAAVAGLAGARFHFIGHLQSNKAARAAALFDVIQTIDSPKLARRLNAVGKLLEVMIEVKLSAEAAKSGVDPEALEELAAQVRQCPQLRLTGLMTMPPWNPDPEASRPYFRRLRQLAERIGVTGLSMGMSHDFEVAVEEGASCVRIGTALFGERPQGKRGEAAEG